MFGIIWDNWCRACRYEIPELEKVYQQIKQDKELLFLSVTSLKDKALKNKKPVDDTKAAILTAAKKESITYPVYVDCEDKAMEEFGIRASPTHIFSDRAGKLVSSVPGEGFGGGLLHILKTLK
ncbi:TlpA disulfide reductase family protein [Streptococcus canis]|uniref:TlpA family protein disulfide reductase n=1 Tax=Streptococcus canis TaxID=1329 RepID=UPI002996F6CA|nr:TlpA disulfide reductase family protein [Streptococcus canis]